MAFKAVPANCVVTGGSGFVGRRLVEMLVERGAKRVVSFDISPKPKDAVDDDRIEYVQGDLSKKEDVSKACKGADCVWHIAALVGPYFEHSLYFKVNYQGTVNVIDACKEHGVRKIVMSSSPSTRFDGSDIEGLTEDQLTYPKKFLQAYAETKAMGEKAMRDACDGKDLLTVAIAPHQVYGPRDMLFLHNFLLNAKRLRVFGNGRNKCSFTHVDNYCHGLILGHEVLYPGSPALGKFYIVTDDEPQVFWQVLDEAIVALGNKSVFAKAKVPAFLIMLIAHICDVISYLTNTKIKLSAFSAKMLIIHRWFNIDAAKKDLGYEPLIPFREGWKQTIEWFKEHWKPVYGK
ncbi:hypothetical protein CYMTET_23556 [Cymbomonas tetramitiformis]|uniref:3-beta hydroxysteroid dehydrogenase/isomerase domain-containing protein n=1 Tax=Cymbomonas tetramitiformis TaxID=36881 RepID=A0AAE0FXQ6_9CHLO|nr:hypothetical protein CYMTET_23556 [Cymbomonas tetramitiformis]